MANDLLGGALSGLQDWMSRQASSNTRNYQDLYGPQGSATQGFSQMSQQLHKPVDPMDVLNQGSPVGAAEAIAPWAAHMGPEFADRISEIFRTINSRNEMYHITGPNQAEGILDAGVIRPGTWDRHGKGVSITRSSVISSKEGGVTFVLDPEKLPQTREIAEPGFGKPSGGWASPVWTKPSQLTNDFEFENRTNNESIPLAAVKKVLINKSMMPEGHPVLQKLGQTNIPVHFVDNPASLKTVRVKPFGLESLAHPSAIGKTAGAGENSKSPLSWISAPGNDAVQGSKWGLEDETKLQSQLAASKAYLESIQAKKLSPAAAALGNQTSKWNPLTDYLPWKTSHKPVEGPLSPEAWQHYLDSKKPDH